MAAESGHVGGPRVAAELRAVESALRDLGRTSATPILTADIMTTAAIPHIRTTDRGYVRLRDGALLGLFR